MNKIYYGEQTKRAVENFGSSILPVDLIHALALVKKASILAMSECNSNYPGEKADAVLSALTLISEGNYDDQFIVPLKQGSAGTSIHMNLCEVTASVAEEIYRENNNKSVTFDPLEDINLYQSTNDIFPTAVTLMAYIHLAEIENLVIKLQETLVEKENEYAEIIMTGRTEMQDALPVTLGQVFGSWAGAVQRDRWRLNKLKERIRTIPLGGTAIGTCFSAPQQYIFKAEQYLRKLSGLPLCRSQNLPDEISNLDKFAELAGGYHVLSQNLFKIAGDLIIYTSSFLKEIEHPSLQFGSTIMAAKTNPVILEYVRGYCLDIQGECFKIQQYSQNGQLQLNAFLPFIAADLIEIRNALKKILTAFIDRFLMIFKINADVMEENLVNSSAIINSLLPVAGYNKIKSIYATILEKKPKTLAELKKLLINESGLDSNIIEVYLNPINLTTFKEGLLDVK